ncbi:hypothetical protein OAW18_00105 [Alphaproteobacteria bacterium]|nr:hypothetical protein [Alphaproteobacteria bacterium]
MPYFPSAPQLTKLVCLPPAFKKQFMTKMMRWQKPVFTNNRIRTQADMALRKKTSSLISAVTIAYFCGKINQLAIITVRLGLAAKI